MAFRFLTMAVLLSLAAFEAHAATALVAPKPTCDIVVQIMRPMQGEIINKIPLNYGSCPRIDGSVTVKSFANYPNGNPNASKVGARLHLLVNDNTVMGPDGAIDTTYWVLDRVEGDPVVAVPVQRTPAVYVEKKKTVQKKAPPKKKKTAKKPVKKAVTPVDAECVAQCKAAKPASAFTP